MGREEAHERVITQLFKELKFGVDKFGPYNSAHEAVAVIEEEFLEFREAVFRNYERIHQRHEALQVAATALRFVLEFTEEDD
jgi:hypothetical protein